MNKCTMCLLVFILIITGPGLKKSVHAALCDPTIAPCNTGSCMPCDLDKEQSKVDPNYCTDPVECPEVTKEKIEPSPEKNIFPVNRQPYNHPPSTCLFCFWNMNAFYWYN